MMEKNIAVKDIDSYLSFVPEKERIALEELRQQILDLVPDAEEVISYMIPTFKYKGALVGFGYYKTHLSFYFMSVGLRGHFGQDLIGYKHEGSTIHFTAEKPLPVEVIRKIVLARVMENEEKERLKRLKKATKKT
ncbi:DUF1801 domain-containing protein [Emticicia sp. W12TSBA100-4]|uniref:iron chaperone n=1 Tax=Emticicia sp. W12TSBA100-4 TaxID=3160965 RepID=UPI00330691B0